MKTASQIAPEVLSGTIRRVIFSSDTYHVFSLRVGRANEITVCGHAYGLVNGERITVRGKWITHKRFGRQFAMESCEVRAPVTAKGVEAYLSGGLIKGIGPATAKRIVEHFGVRALDIIREKPERLEEVSGIGPKKAKELRRSIEEHKNIEKIMVALQEHGVSTAYAMRIRRHFDQDAVQVLKKEPYKLTEVNGIGFLIADRIAKKQGVPDSDPGRVRAGLLYVLEQAAGDGHVCLPIKDLQKHAADILGCEPAMVAGAIDDLCKEEKVIERQAEGTRWLYLSALYASEKGISTRIGRIQDSARPLAADANEAEKLLARQGLGIKLAPGQRKAVLAALRGGLVVITGGPGTGKTTITKAVVDIFTDQRRRVILAAPTGRAAKRLSESTGRPASTIHRLLKWQPSGQFEVNEQRPLKCDLLVIDEASMLDTYLAYQVLRAVPEGASVLLVGDVDQLPSVGPGRVLNDIIESGAVPVLGLTEIFRQAAGSLIIQNAHRINRGQMPLASNQFRDPDMFFMPEEDPEALRSVILEIVSKRIPLRYGLDPVRDIQVLTPMRRGVLGIQAFNEHLQNLLNPARTGEPVIRNLGREFRIGDKVMQIRNNYDKEVFNGDMGFAVNVDAEAKALTVFYEGLGNVRYENHELDELAMAYAISVHKSQGSEFPVVVMPVHTQHFIMLQRNLLYTGVTRGKELVVLAGTRKALGIAVKSHTVPKRYSHLKSLLVEKRPRAPRQDQLSLGL